MTRHSSWTSVEWRLTLNDSKLGPFFEWLDTWLGLVFYFQQQQNDTMQGPTIKTRHTENHNTRANTNTARKQQTNNWNKKQKNSSNHNLVNLQKAVCMCLYCYICYPHTYYSWPFLFQVYCYWGPVPYSISTSHLFLSSSETFGSLICWKKSFILSSKSSDSEVYKDKWKSLNALAVSGVVWCGLPFLSLILVIVLFEDLLLNKLN